MFIVISPAKKLNENIAPGSMGAALPNIPVAVRPNVSAAAPNVSAAAPNAPQAQPTIPAFTAEAQELISILKKMSEQQLMQLMGISQQLAALNLQRYKNFSLPLTSYNAYCAAFFFHGDVYQGLEITTLKQQDIIYMQQRLRILSGLFGLLKPLDLILPYRLEMGSSLANKYGTSLYDFWGDKITMLLGQQMEEAGDKLLVNLASNEYFASVLPSKVPGNVITPKFKDYKNGQYKVIGLLAKKARGMMARYIIENRLSKPSDLLLFDLDGYSFSPSDSTPDTPVFLRKKVQAA